MFWTIIKVIVSAVLGLVALAILYGLGSIIYYIFVGYKKDEVKRINRENAKAEFAEHLKQKRIGYAKYKNSLYEKYGEPDKVIRYSNNIDSEIIVFDKSSIVIIDCKELSFDDIISCSLIDDSRIERGDVSTTINTKTNTGSLIGRSVVGGLIAGPVGAVIGASSASRTSYGTSVGTSDTKIFNYSLIIGVRRIEYPTIKIHLGHKRDLAYEILAVFNIILSEKSRR